MTTPATPVLAQDAEQAGLKSERSFWRLAATVCGVVALGKTLHPPYSWAATQAQVDYRFGLVKRGLFGALFTNPLHLQRFERFSFFSFFLLALLVASIVVFIKRSGLMRRLSTVEVLALFFSSYAITYLALLTGYLEIPLAILTIALLLVRDPKKRLLWTLPGTVAGLLMHELFLFVFLPTLLLSFLLQDYKAGMGQGMLKAGCIAILAVVVAAALALRPALTTAQVETFKSEVTRNVDFEPDGLFFSVMRRPISSNFAEMKSSLRHAGWWKVQVISSLTIAPTVVLLLMISMGFLRAAGIAIKGIAGIAVIVATLSPLLMHLFGADVGRWNALTILSGFLVTLTTCYYTRGGSLRLTPDFRRWLVVVTMLNMASGGILIGDYRVRAFPFIPDGHVSFSAWMPSHWQPSHPTPTGH